MEQSAANASRYASYRRRQNGRNVKNAVGGKGRNYKDWNVVKRAYRTAYERRQASARQSVAGAKMHREEKRRRKPEAYPAKAYRIQR